MINLKICSPQLGISPKSYLGGEICDREILKGVAKKYVKVEIILPKGKQFDKNVKNWNITPVAISRAPAILYNFIFLPYLFKIYKKSRFDVLRIHSPRYIGLGALIFKFFHPEIKLLASYHNFWETNFNYLSKWINNQWDHIFCDSRYVSQKMHFVYKIPLSKISYGYNGVSEKLKPRTKNRKLLKKLKIENKTILLFVGTFTKRKNPLFLLDVLDILVKRNLEVILFYLGKGALKKKILKKAADLNLLENIRIIDPVYGQEKNQIFNLADIFVHPSMEEGFSLVVVEAMACSKPVIITNDYSAPEQVINGVNGFLCKVNNLKEWASKIEILIKDDQLRKKMGKHGEDLVRKKFQWKYAVEEHIKIFNKLKNE